MKKFTKIIVALLLVFSSLVACVSCNRGGDELEFIDYAGNTKLDMSSESLKEEVTVKAYIDGDTTHFHVPTSVVSSGVLKARYLAINTPESTGKIEEWGKKLSSAPKFKKWKFACLGDYVEYGNKKSAQQFGMKFVTKMPVYICPVNPDLAYWEEEGKKITPTINSLN